MSITDGASGENRLEELPQFDLEYLFDDEDNPKEVTIFNDQPEYLSKQWISAKLEYVVPLEEVR